PAAAAAGRQGEGRRRGEEGEGRGRCRQGESRPGRGGGADRQELPGQHEEKGQARPEAHADRGRGGAGETGRACEAGGGDRESREPSTASTCQRRATAARSTA